VACVRHGYQLLLPVFISIGIKGSEPESCKVSFDEMLYLGIVLILGIILLCPPTARRFPSMTKFLPDAEQP
jgi:hypothetical protein